ncbi:C40 family peptidase [Pseudomonas sp. SCB32]|uniref:C40 family peptidase n=1 Tax=Pseudomonas sp. SCB32 TaxID=2653853 RepID=UPI0012643520|nr:C40 family peptidase [Pseudomonas sp. SCB32]
MRPVRWIPLLWLCAISTAGTAFADDLGVPSWRKYKPAALTTDDGLSSSVKRRPSKDALHPIDTQRIVSRAHELIGTPYRWGGDSSDKGFDCSGLLVYLYRSIVNHELPRTTASMLAQRHKEVSRDELRPGDAVFFNSNGEGRISHVGLYVGNSRFIHAPRRGKAVRIDSMDNSYWQRSYTTARRFRG